MNKAKIILSYVCVAFLLSACGGSSSNDKKDGKQDNDKKDPIVTKGDITGRVVDGYIKGANVFYDKNMNFIYDAGSDVKSISDKNGIYKLKGVELKAMANLLVSIGGEDVDTGKKMKQVLSASPMKDDGKELIYITPTSTIFVKTALEIVAKKGSHNSLTMKNFQGELLRIFDLPKNYLHVNPLKSTKLYKTNQAIQKTIEMTGLSYKDLVSQIAKDSKDLKSIISKYKPDNYKEALKLIDYINSLDEDKLEDSNYRQEQAKKIQKQVDDKKVVLTPEPQTPKDNGLKIVGRVVDGYISGSLVFLDTNGNFKYDNSEPSDTTDEYGRFEIKGFKKDQINMMNSLLATGGNDVDTGIAMTQTFMFSPSLEDIKKSIYLTPISTTITAVAKKLAFGGGDYNGFSMTGGFKGKVLSILGTDEASYNNNPIKDHKLYKITQKIQKIIELNNWTYADFAANLNANMSSLKDMPGLNQASKNFIDFMDQLSDDELDKKRVNIAKEAQKQIDQDKFDPYKIDVSKLPEDKEQEDVDDFAPYEPKEGESVKEGHVYFPYNINATVFLDENRNSQWDEGEKRVKTDKNGLYSMGLSDDDISKRLPIVAVNGKDKNGNKEKYPSILFTTPMTGFDITPLSTFHTSSALALLQNMMQEPGIMMSNFSDIAAKSLGVEPTQFGANYNDDQKLFRANLAINNLAKALAVSLDDGRDFKEKFVEYYKLLSANISGHDYVNPIDELLERMAKQNVIEGERKKLLKEILQTCQQSSLDEMKSGVTQKNVDELLERIKNYKEEVNRKEPSAEATVYNGLPKDDYSKYQWHLLDQGAVVNTNGIATVGGNDLGVEGLYKRGIFGKGVKVRIVDDGYYAEHEDLKKPLDMENSYNAETGKKDPTPPKKTDTHGTQVAGLIGADGSNAKGLRGVAPYVKMEAFKIKTAENGGLEISEADLRKAWLGGDDSVAIVNNSWGATAITRNPDDEKILEEGVRMRGGLGRIYLIAAGNSGFNQGEDNFGSDDAVTSYTRNSQYSITVGSVRNENIITQYSSQGSNILVSSYGGGIFPTTAALMATTAVPGTSHTTWKSDLKKQYTFAFNGTSAATPVASGALALVLEKCPNLSYRDVKWLIAHTASKVDPNYDGLTIKAPNVPPYHTAPQPDNDSGFGMQENGYGYVENGAGLTHSNYYGYGLINPAGMIAKCTAPGFSSLPPKKTNKFVQETTSLSDLSNPAASLGEIIKADPLTVSSSNRINKVEWVGLTVYATFEDLKKISIVLISPSGTVSRVLTHSVTALTELGEFGLGYRLSSVAFVDENPYGDWKVLVHTDSESGESGRVTKLELEIVGHER